ncbi:HAD family hydrolase [Spiribacter vilamensis]|uniref:HAD superfamily hydrolase (TIGR01490 family) n=1 Tax=Spiribacter vilamensis TaxID=531306 RepID=A0A4V2GJB7_9GAMM|nr:HAD family hydrolase [Spiribacter vilamensis]RZU99705.1 HAD superfamily hydrolase (TIGR01490 family) [Spiribacter vilamensis]TVO61348.1 HAD family hydrolase [Spiribacter vilamensis]
MQLAIFDLDNTLLAGDSDYLWGQHLMEQGAVPRARFEEDNQRFMRDYEAGRLDIDAFLRFALKPLAETPEPMLLEWRRAFIDRHIRPRILPAARALVEDHRRRGHALMIITATNRFVTSPIAELFDIPMLLATEPERDASGFTGRAQGVPTFREGKITALQAWLDAQETIFETVHFYSDSQNDLPLLEHVDRPVAIDPDPTLAAAARERGWPTLTLRKGDTPEPLQ